MKKLVALSMILVILLSCSFSAFAMVPEADAGDAKYLIQTDTYYSEELGELVTESLYVSKEYFMRGASGSDTYSYEKRHQSSSLTFYVSGYFTWNQDQNSCTVSDVGYGHSDSAYTITNEKIASDSNVRDIPGVGRRYAYAKYSLTAVNSIGGTSKLSVQVKVASDGKVYNS